MPERIQLRRTKGWRKPDGAIVVARPSQWGNPFTVAGAIENGYAESDDSFARQFVTDCFRDWLIKGPSSFWWWSSARPQWDSIAFSIARDLAGHDLACWCPLDGAPCHADVLLELANG